MLSLRGLEIYEVKLGEAFLMSGLFHEVEQAMARFGLAELKGKPWDVVVGLGSVTRGWRHSTIAKSDRCYRRVFAVGRRRSSSFAELRRRG
jgi:hypothetical protein